MRRAVSIKKLMVRHRSPSLPSHCDHQDGTALTVGAQAGVAGGVNAEGCIGQAEAWALAARLNTFPGSLSDPAELDGTVSSWENVDRDLLKKIESSSRNFYYTTGTHDMAAAAQAIADQVRCGD